MTPPDRAEPCLPALTHEQWIAARDRMLNGSDSPARRYVIEAAMERAFGPCPAKPVLPFKMMTQGGSWVSLVSYGSMSLLSIRSQAVGGAFETACSMADLRRVGEACLKAAA